MTPSVSEWLKVGCAGIAVGRRQTHVARRCLWLKFGPDVGSQRCQYVAIISCRFGHGFVEPVECQIRHSPVDPRGPGRNGDVAQNPAGPRLGLRL